MRGMLYGGSASLATHQQPFSIRRYAIRAPFECKSVIGPLAFLSRRKTPHVY